jgi:hypothetical protein
MLAHTFSIILNLVGSLSEETYGISWYSLKPIDITYWQAKYVWGYYWAITIMLTVGFGDINATTMTEAIAIIFISMFSCLVLSFNISEINKILHRINLTN